MPLNHCLPCLCNNNENLLLGREYLCVLIVVLVREGPWKIRLGPGKVLEKSRNFIIRKAWEPWTVKVWWQRTHFSHILTQKFKFGGKYVLALIACLAIRWLQHLDINMIAHLSWHVQNLVRITSSEYGWTHLATIYLKFEALQKNREICPVAHDIDILGDYSLHY